MNIRTTFALLACAVFFLAPSSLSAQGASGGSARLGDLRGATQANFNQDASRLIVRSRGGEIGLWDVEKGTAVGGDLGVQTPSERPGL